jgi:hypothetical protein
VSSPAFSSRKIDYQAWPPPEASAVFIGITSRQRQYLVARVVFDLWEAATGWVARIYWGEGRGDEFNAFGEG